MMQKRKRRVAVLGAGAIGSYVIWGFAPSDQAELVVLAQGERAARLREQGVVINGERMSVQVCDPQQAGEIDLLFVCLKYDALRGALPMIAAACSPQTVVLSLMNGVDSEQIIRQVVPAAQVLCAVIKIQSTRTAQGVHFVPPTGRQLGISYGAERESQEGAVERAQEILALSRLNAHRSDQILLELWSKFALNVSQNLPQAMVGCGMGAYEDSEHVEFLSRALWDEVVAVAAAQGIDLSSVRRYRPSELGVRKDAHYSTLQDLDAGRHTEIDMLGGSMIRMGERCHVPVPYCTFAFHLIRALEEKNDGRFDYA